MKYLVFDSKFTNYENLAKLDKAGIKLITIKRRGKKIVNRLENLPKGDWKSIRIDRGGNKKETIKVLDEIVYLRNYNDNNEINIDLKKKRNLPQILQMASEYNQLKDPWLNNFKLILSNDIYS